MREEFGAESHQLHQKTVPLPLLPKRELPERFHSTEREHRISISKSLFSLVLMELGDLTSDKNTVKCPPVFSNGSTSLAKYANKHVRLIIGIA